MIALPSLSLARALRAAAPFIFLSAMTGLAACGGAEAKAPQSREPREMRDADTSEPTTVDEAQAQISRARDQLAVTVTEAQPVQPGTGGGPMSTSPLPTPAPPPAAEPARPADTSSPQKSASTPRIVEESRCASSCRALASMRRAVTALCRMTGDADNRCVDARRTLTDSERRIPPCSC